MNAAAGGIVGLLCGLVFGLVVGGSIGALILLGACGLYNKLASASAKVQPPNFLKAAGIVIASAIVNVVISLALGFMLGAAFGPDNIQTAQILVNVIGLPVSLAVMAALLSAMIPTTFLRGLAISGLYLVIMIAVAIVIGIVVFVVILAMAGAR